MRRWKRALVRLGAGAALAAAGLHAQSPVAEQWREYPSFDASIALRLREGVTAKEAARQLMQAPGSPETFTLLVRAHRLDDAVQTLRQALDGDLSTSVAALRALSVESSSFRDETRAYPDAIRSIVQPVRSRIAMLPREDAARLAWALFPVDWWLSGLGSQGWSESLAKFVQDYAGTQAGLLAEVDLLSSNTGELLQSIAALEGFAKAHPGTEAGAKALYEAASHLGFNAIGTAIEPRGSDPTARLLRTAAIVAELESGKYPKSRWVEQAPALISGFFVSQQSFSSYSPANLDRAIAVYLEFVRKHLQAKDQPDALGQGVEYVISTKLGDLFQVKGDRVGGIERTLADLEAGARDPRALQLFRALYYVRQPAMAAKGRAALSALATANRGFASRQALATLAAWDFYNRDYREALPAYQEYLVRYPSSSWAWVAAIRTGQCYEFADDWPRAAAAYAQAASAYPTEPVARVLGRVFAARALAAQGRFEESLPLAQSALSLWDADYGTDYTVASPQAPLRVPVTGPAIDRWRIAKEVLADRTAALERDLGRHGGLTLARGRWQFDQHDFAGAAGMFAQYLRDEPESPAAGETRRLLHRAQLELALDLAAVEGPHHDEGAAVAALDALASQPFDAGVAAAGLAKAAILLMRGSESEADALMGATLNAWIAFEKPRLAAPPTSGIDADVAEIRQVVFRPLGDLSVYGGMRLNAFRFPSGLPPFIIIRSDVSVKTADGRTERRVVHQAFKDLDHVLFLDTDEIALVSRLVPTIGGTKRREPTQVMQTPNQPTGSSVDILTFWNRFFPARPGHWFGWEIETYPNITQIEFTNAERTRANVNVTIGYSGATVMLEKVDGKWKAVRLTNEWVT